VLFYSRESHKQICVCVCVCVRERERGEGGTGPECVFNPPENVLLRGSFIPYASELQYI